MSTGLTWLYTCPFPEATAPENGSTIISFSSYEEANEYAQWLIVNLESHGNENVRVFVWTSGPGQNGFWYIGGGEPIFVNT